MILKKLTLILFPVSLSLLLVSCGGGGGGGGASSGSEQGVRVLNASIDAPPVEIAMEGYQGSGETLASFGEAGFRAEVSGSAINIAAKSKTNDSLLSQVPAPESKDAPYTLVLYGSAIAGGHHAKLLSDIVAGTADSAQTDITKAGITKAGTVVSSVPSTPKVRFFNAVNNAPQINISFADKQVAVPFGAATEFYNTDSTITVTTTAGGGTISQRTFDLPAEKAALKAADLSGDAANLYTVVYMGEQGLLVFSKVV